MQDNDSYQNVESRNSVEEAKSSEASLITTERSQKLDLLIHLITNLRQSLVICGPHGIGKTIILDALTARKKNDWSIVSIRGSSNLSYESIQDQISQFLKHHKVEYANQDYTSLLSALDKQSQKILILIDDAGQLVPGLISSLIQFATEYPCLRLVFALTADELHIKNSSDQAVNDCHFIEIPPLTEKQCGAFLQLLSAQPRAIVPYKAINDRLVEKLYRETHGIPGKIVSELPKLSNYSGTDNFNWITAGVVILLGVSAISFYISDDHELQPKDETVKTSLLLQKPGNVEVSSPVIQSFNNETTDTILKDQLIEDTFDFAVLEKNSVAKNKAVVAVIEKNPNGSNFQPKEKSAEKIDFQGNNVIAEVNKNNLAKVEKILSASKENTSFNTGTEVQLVNEKIVTVDDQQIQSTEEKFELDDSKWVLEQPKKNITIQLMVLSKRESIQDVLKKNNKLRGKLKYFKKGVLDKTKYILIYGSYKNIATASKSMKKLPKKYRKSWLRKFKDLQKIIKN